MSMTDHQIRQLDQSFFDEEDARPERDWKPIETAPKDGTSVELMFPDRRTVIGRWGRWYWEEPAGGRIVGQPDRWDHVRGTKAT